MSTTRRLAVPFVLSIAALPSCMVRDEGVHPNPPPPPNTTATGTAAPPTTAPATARPLVPTTPPLIKIRKAQDGTCWQDEDTKCPPEPATCNPPPPRKVDCPK